ncbi:uncharacterized protein LOC120769062 [Bactrocera tryoni]|uniref:uncharacterized protein LOC120769062 n=1 Tax=Bactrocera tryoni TaxID=59916 RepID=UPI001A964987|nr:uncharacterized protein LOC120769062 [Bactrocera tryoni]
MVLKIVQWNINGYHNNNNELRLLIKENNYKIIALQETHLKESPPTRYVPKNFSIYGYNDISTEENAKRGVAFLVADNIEFTPLELHTSLLAIAIKVKSQINFTFLNIYSSPDDQFAEHDLHELISYVNGPLLIVGDLNAWSPIWGSPRFNSKGKIGTKFIENTNLLILNDKSPIPKYKRANAIFKREVKTSKRDAFATFTKDINCNTPSKVLWNKVNVLHGNRPHNLIHSIEKENNSSTSDPLEIGNTLARAWSNYSKNFNFSEQFVEHKNRFINVINVVYPLSKTSSAMEGNFSIQELDGCLASLKGKSPGQDNIPYELLKHLPFVGKSKLCELYNHIFNTHTIPQQWYLYRNLISRKVLPKDIDPYPSSLAYQK